MDILNRIDQVIGESIENLSMGGRVVPDTLLDKGVIRPTKKSYSNSSSRGKSWAWRVISDVEKSMERMCAKKMDDIEVKCQPQTNMDSSLVCQISIVIPWDEVASALFNQFRGSKKVEVHKGDFAEFLSSFREQQLFADELNNTISPINHLADNGISDKILDAVESTIGYGTAEQMRSEGRDVRVLTSMITNTDGGMKVCGEIQLAP